MQDVRLGHPPSYTYDGDGKRVVKSNGTAYWTGTGSEALTETDLSSSGTILAEYVFFGGTRVARIDSPLGQTPSVHYYFADLIKSVNVVTNSAGAIQNESMFYPFGGERVLTAGDANHYKFTGKERDTSVQETGLDYFGARYYTSTVGRWMSPDWSAAPAPVPYGDLANPQSLNLYAYVGNNPVTGVDPDGHMSAALFNWGGRFAARPAPNRGVGIFDNGFKGMPPEPTMTMEIHSGDSTTFVEVPEGQAVAAVQSAQQTIDKEKVATTINANAPTTNHFTGHCAHACKVALHAGGANLSGAPKSGEAKDHGPWLLSLGAKVVAQGTSMQLPSAYTPAEGDVAVFQGGQLLGKGGELIHSYSSGHMQIYDGKQWISDTKQPNFAPNRNYPGGYAIYRFP